METKERWTFDERTASELEDLFEDADSFGLSNVVWPRRALPCSNPDSHPKRHKPSACQEEPAVNAILHVDVDSFYVTAERMRRPDLIGLPVAVTQFHRGGFVALSQEARACGLRKGDAVGDQGRKHIKFLNGCRSLEECLEL